MATGTVSESLSLLLLDDSERIGQIGDYKEVTRYCPPVVVVR